MTVSSKKKNDNISNSSATFRVCTVVYQTSKILTTETSLQHILNIILVHLFLIQTNYSHNIHIIAYKMAGSS